jgi:hypothetical protein
MSVGELYISIQISQLGVAEVAHMVGVYVGGIRVIDVYFSPCFKNVGAVIYDAAVTIKQRGSLPQLYVACYNSKLGAVINSSEFQVPGVVENMYGFGGIPDCLRG